MYVFRGNIQVDWAFGVVLFSCFMVGRWTIYHGWGPKYLLLCISERSQSASSLGGVRT